MEKPFIKMEEKSSKEMEIVKEKKESRKARNEKFSESNSKYKETHQPSRRKNIKDV